VRQIDCAEKKIEHIASLAYQTIGSQENIEYRRASKGFIFSRSLHVSSSKAKNATAGQRHSRFNGGIYWASTPSNYV
jgi:hypothetical protein